MMPLFFIRFKSTSVKAVNSANTTTLASKVVVNLSTGIITVDLSPSVFIAPTAVSALVTIKDRAGIVLASKVFSEVETDTLTADIPTIDSVYKWGDYSVETLLTDAGATYLDINKRSVAYPDKPNVNYGIIGLDIRAKCQLGKTMVLASTPPDYQGKPFTSYSELGGFYYPNGSAEASLITTFTPFYAKLKEGRNEFKTTTSATYDFDNNFSIVVDFKGTLSKNIVCYSDLCVAYAAIHDLIEKAAVSCDSFEVESLQSKIDTSVKLVSLITLGDQCSFDTGDLVAELETLLKVNMSCPGIPALELAGTPADSVIIQGCNVEEEMVGLTSRYTINNYAYEISLQNQQGAVTRTNTTDGCTKIITLSFDWSVVADIMLTQFEGSKNNRFLSIINTALNSVTVGCVTSLTTWRTADLIGKFDLLIAKMCACCSDTVVGLINVVPDCETAVITENFQTGISDTGSIAIPITVTGAAGSITASVTGTGLSGSLATMPVVLGGSTITVPVSYNGSGSAGSRNATVTIFFGDSSAACVIPLNITSDPICTAPGVPVVNKSGNVITVGFGAATSEPPLYRVQRRLKSAADIDANYTILSGSPAYNISTSKYEISETWTSAELNKVWIYKAISLCTGLSRPFSIKEYISQTCPVVTIGKSSTTVTYSFPHVGGDTNQYRVALYNGITLIGTIQTKAVSPSPVTGSFTGLTASTAYSVKVYNEITGTAYSNECVSAVTTDPIPLTVTFSNQSTCTTGLQTRTFNINSTPGTALGLALRMSGYFNWANTVGTRNVLITANINTPGSAPVGNPISQSYPYAGSTSLQSFDLNSSAVFNVTVDGTGVLAVATTANIQNGGSGGYILGELRVVSVNGTTLDTPYVQNICVGFDTV